MGEDMREGLQTPEMLHWLAQNVEPERLRELIDPGDFVARVIAAISDTTGGGDGDKSRELLKSLFTSDESITRIFSMLTAVQRRDVLSRLSDIRAWDPVERRSVVARVVRRFPELKQSMEAARSADGEEKSNRLTSWRTYNERREKLRRLVEVEIPQNSREIGVARSYGDLRENHEYKAAKEHQGILMRRKAEYERDLAEVKGTSFEEATPETAGMGVRIEIERPDGKVQEFSILGEWDSDEKLGIVSSESLIAKSVLGLRAGDQVELPAVDGREGQLENCTVKRILPLSQQVRDWIAERAPAG
jgi:transcription elongation GreA/GreB family factor